MTNQTPQTLDDLFAAADAAVAELKQEDARIASENATYAAAVEAAQLTAAARYIPQALLSFISLNNQTDDGCAIFTITAPGCWPICFSLYEFNSGREDKGGATNPENWRPGVREDPLWMGGTHYPRFSFSQLPLILGLAKERREPPAPATPAPVAPAPVRIDLADGLINMLDRAEGEKDADFTVRWVTARALVGLMVHLEDIKISLDVIQERTPHSY